VHERFYVSDKYNSVIAVLFVEFKKAFDKVHHYVAFCTFVHYGFRCYDQLSLSLHALTYSIKVDDGSKTN